MWACTIHYMCNGFRQMTHHHTAHSHDGCCNSQQQPRANKKQHNNVRQQTHVTQQQQQQLCDENPCNALSHCHALLLQKSYFVCSFRLLFVPLFFHATGFVCKTLPHTIPSLSIPSATSSSTEPAILTS